MGNTHIETQAYHINKPSAVVYGTFEDFTRFTAQLPEDKKANIVATQDSISTQMQGMEMGIEVVKREPCSLVQCKQSQGTPFAFNLEIRIAEDGNESSLQMVVDAEFPMFIKMMLEPKLKSMLEQMVEQMAAGMNRI